MEREPRVEGLDASASQGQVQRVDGEGLHDLQDRLTGRTPALPIVSPSRVSPPDSWVARICDRMLDDAEARPQHGGRASRGWWRGDGGATLWGGLVIVVVKIAFAAALFLMLAKSLQ